MAVLLFCLLATACGGGGSSDSGCSGDCGDATSRLLVADVERVMAQAVQEAQARNARATIAVVDRVGNVLGVYRMTAGVPADLQVTVGVGKSGGLEGINVIPDTLAAIAKAVTGAYLSTEGNAFSTRTASQIVQEFFNPGERGQPGGPLFGVQFSSLPCSDLSLRFAGGAAGAGPQRSPLGLAADPGGFPLYKNGTVVGGVGVMADGHYGADPEIFDRDQDLDELIATAASAGYGAPADRRADRITVAGLSLRYSDAAMNDLSANPAAAPAFASLGAAGSLVAVPGYTTALLRDGTAFGTPASGIQAAVGDLAALDAFVLVGDDGLERYAPRAGTDAADTGGQPLAAVEVSRLLRESLDVANRARAQIRRPLSTPARVTVSVVDTHGVVLGVARTRDAPVFGADVSLQKARTAMFFSSARAAADLQATPDTTYLANGEVSPITDYLNALRLDFAQPTLLADGAVAFSARAVGNLARPLFPDGIPQTDAGALSKPLDRWSPFSTGLQLDLVNDAIVQHVVFGLGGGADVAAGACTQLPLTPAGISRLANGAQIFAGGVPIYRGLQLVGAIGVSGDGIEQDDMIAFLGLHNAGAALNGALNNAPSALRSDRYTPRGVALRYVQCPQAPFIGSDVQNVCAAK